MVARWRLQIAYDGTDFHGWARQPGLRTVEQTLSDALTTITHASQTVDIVCAGRTDAGVHARGQVAHADLGEFDHPSRPGRSATGVEGDRAGNLLRRLEGVLPGDVAVRAAEQVSAEFDARFSALSRRYAYRVADSHMSRDPLRTRDVISHPRLLDIEAMNEAGRHLVGEHDFAAFCRPRPAASTVRRVIDCAWRRDEEGRAVLTITADAFCHSMVRAIVGALIAVGDGRRDAAWVQAVLTRGHRDSGVTVMPARGLTLEEVTYPPEGEWAQRQQVTRSVRAPL